MTAYTMLYLANLLVLDNEVVFFYLFGVINNAGINIQAYKSLPRFP